MPLVALENGKNKVFAWNISRRAPLYNCPNCGGRMIFMDCRLKVKYFRHYEKCECESEPETKEHVWGKQEVYKTILNMKDPGSVVELEYNVDNLRADVYWESPWQKAAIEIQATNYTIGVFEEKIYEYARKGLVIIYLFVGSSFLKETRSFIYSLKEIEKRIFVNKNLPGIIYAGYLKPSGNVFIPSFQEKWASGGGDCTHRFISMRSNEKTKKLSEFLIEAVFRKTEKLDCTHEKVKYVLSSEKITRYKVLCEKCEKFIKWLPNIEARDLGLLL